MGNGEHTWLAKSPDIYQTKCNTLEKLVHGIVNDGLNVYSDIQANDITTSLPMFLSLMGLVLNQILFKNF